MNDKLTKVIAQLPRTPGVYLFYGRKGEILYIGKATYLRDRVRSYFSYANPLINANQLIANRPIEQIIHRIEKVEVKKTDSVLEALILESNLIKKHQPKYNVDLKDGKSFSYFVITRAPKQSLVRGAAKQKFPRVLIMRESDLEKSKEIIKHQFGPYTSKKNMEVALGIIRKIFPFHSGKIESEKGCLDFQIGRCPGPYAGAITRAGYLKNIWGIRMILEGKKKSLVRRMENEMKELSQKQEFEKAAELRNKVFALKHIQDIALISAEGSTFGAPKVEPSEALRIEAYDISNISGQQAVGSMVVFNNHKPDKSQYRKLKIKTVAGADDVGMMREVLSRRFNNAWPKPDLILLDGGIGHLNMGKEILKSLKLDIPMVAVAKGATRKNQELRVMNHEFKKEIKIILDDKNLMKQIMDEAHRFAIAYHKKLRKKAFI